MVIQSEEYPIMCLELCSDLYEVSMYTPDNITRCVDYEARRLSDEPRCGLALRYKVLSLAIFILKDPH